ncbi:hypothetical protein LPJ64_003493 [Coemansia asiatica]|uniref:Uncharacterized protein n=1 Tax=Coemansia asiatica TaxID=1052880 RepID=A0A9W7XJN1_9FUNG|nr:hypothetical protein LPJ64_003493 [Coemansia asiatica]
MSAKRSLAEAEADTNGSGKLVPFTSYSDVHYVLVSLEGTLLSEEDINHMSKRALLTVNTAALPSAVQQVAVRLVAQLCTHPTVDSMDAVSGLVEALYTSEPSVRCEIYQAMLKLHELKGLFADVHLAIEAKQRLDDAVMRDLNHSQHHLRCSSLAVLPMVRPQKTQSTTVIDVFDTICKYTTDAHPKVRQTALNAIFREHLMAVNLPVEMYDECVVATKDDFEQVRLVAVELVWAISSTYPEYPVVIQKFKVTETIRLLDDAFVKICDMVNDSSVVVRQRACTILGRFKNVDSKFLSQTFSKQVMSHLRRFVPRGGTRGYAGRNRGVRGNQQRSFIPTPKGDADVESDEFRLLDSGAAGAFVHGLEDEYQEVRDAAIDSITELSIGNASFAAKAVDFLVDMFNDSSDRVRLCAIRALVSIGERSLIQLTEEQLSIALSAMKDASHIMRHGIYEFLAVSSLAKSENLAQLMTAFKSNLEKYPEDQMPIYLALKALGNNHSSMINAAFVRSLLGISEHYLSREARIDDIVYAGSIVLIMNTKVATRNTLVAVLPDYVYSHLPYLRDKYRGCLPDDILLTVPEKHLFVKHLLDTPHVDESVARLYLEDRRDAACKAFASLQDSLSRFCLGFNSQTIAASGDGGDHAIKSGAILKRKIDEYNIHQSSALSGTAEAEAEAAAAAADPSVRHYEHTVMYYARLASNIPDMQILSAKLYQHVEVLELASKTMYGLYEIEIRTVGLDLDSLLALRYLRLFAHALWLNCHQANLYDPRVAEKLMDEFSQRVRRLVQLAKSRSAEISALEILALDIKNKRISTESISTFIDSFKPLLFAPSTGRCQYALASFIKPSLKKRIIEFNHLFPLNLKIKSSVVWVPHRESIFVTVRMPTQKCVKLCPPPSSLKPLAPMHWSLEWDSVSVSLPLGSGESTSITIDIALRQAADMPWADSFIVKGNLVPRGYKIENYFKCLADDNDQYVDIHIADDGYTVNVNAVEFKPPASIHTRA